MKILQVYEKPLSAGGPRPAAVGGVETYLATLIQGLESRGSTVSTLRFVRRGAEVPPASGRHYVLEGSSLRPAPGLKRALQVILEREQPDVVHLHSVFYALGPGLLRWLGARKPLAMTLHEVSPLCFWRTRVMSSGRLCDRAVGAGCLTCGCYRPGGAAPLAQDLVRIAFHGRHLEEYRRLPLLIVPSRYMAEQLAINAFESGRVRVVPLPSPFPPAAAPPDPGRNRILFVGRLTPGKGVRELIESLARLRAENWEALLLGEGELLDETRRRIEAAGLAGRVRVEGPCTRERLAEHYRSASVVVFPSMAPESFGLVGLEAMAHARPVVAFAAGGVTEWLEHGRTGLAAPRGDVAGLAAHLDRLLEDAPLRRRLGENALAAARGRFALEPHLDRIVALYEERRAAFGRVA